MASAKKLYLPSAWPTWGGHTAQALSLDASTEKLCVRFRAKEAATITDLGYRYGVRTGTPPTYKISLQGLDASGHPDGTVKGGGSPASATFTPPADTTINNLFRWQTLDNPYAVTASEKLAWVIEHSSGTIDASNFSSFAPYASQGAMIYMPGFPNAGFYNGSAWSKETTWVPIWGYKSSTNVYGRPLQSAGSLNVLTSGNRIAAKFNFSADWGDTFKIAAIDFPLLTSGGSGTFKIGVWNAAGTALQSDTIDTDELNSGETNMQMLTFSSPAALSFGTTYYLGVEALGTSTQWLDYLQFSEANDLKSMPGEGDFGISTWNGSAWSDDVDALLLLAVHLDDITEPAGGGGGLVSPIISAPGGGLIIRG